MDIYLSKTICSNLELDNETISTYVALRSLYNVDKPIMYVNDTMLCYELLGSTDIPRRFKDSIHKSLTNLVGIGLVSIVEEISKSEYILDLSKLFIGMVKDTKEYYVTVSLCEIRKIFNVEGRVDKFALCRYFIQMMNTINFNEGIYVGSGSATREITNFVGYMPQDYLAKISGITTNSIITYNEILESNKLIYVFRHDSYIHENGTIKSFTNHYGRYANKEYIIQFAKQYEDTQDGLVSEEVKLTKKKSNNGRSFTQKYNALCRGKEYSIEEIEEIYNYIHGRNITLLEKIEDEFLAEQYIDGYKDEEVFKPYLDEDGNFLKRV